jgi:hypothetical protein
LPVKIRDGQTPPARISQLKNYDAYVTINGIDVDIQYMVQNANGGDEIAVYLSDDTHNLDVNDKLMFAYTDGLENTFPVYSINGNDFVIYENAKYLVESDIADTALIDGVEYDIEYPNGKEIGKDALVAIDGELIPMLLVGSDTGGTETGDTVTGDTEIRLKRYGLIVSGDPTSPFAVTEAYYDIVTHDGVRIDGNVYRIIGDEDNGK